MSWGTESELPMTCLGVQSQERGRLSATVPAKKLFPIATVWRPGRPLSGSTPVKKFSAIPKKVTFSIARMPPSGSAPAKWLA
eukprot:2659855-Amphidinium_carterae.2